MERYTERDINGVARIKPGYCEAAAVIMAAQRLAEYEDAEEQGLLLRLPCKIGATIYALAKCCQIQMSCDDDAAYRLKYDYEQPKIKPKIIELKFILNFLRHSGGLIPWHFLTREEAEKALTEINENNYESEETP